MTKEYQKRNVLIELYQNQKMTIHEIADKFEVSSATIYNWMNKNNINSRKPGSSTETPTFRTTEGYERWETQYNSKVYQVYVHRLLAVCKFGFDKVCDMDVHHKNGVKWDNRPENINILSREDHNKMHSKKK
jgi:transposase-like protein